MADKSLTGLGGWEGDFLPEQFLGAAGFVDADGQNFGVFTMAVIGGIGSVRGALIAALLVKAGARISVAENSRKVARIANALETLEGRSVPRWLETEKAKFEGVVKALPAREDITIPIQEQLIVELYSR